MSVRALCCTDLLFLPPSVAIWKTNNTEVIYLTQQIQILQAPDQSGKPFPLSPLTPSFSHSEGKEKCGARRASARAGFLRCVESPVQLCRGGSCHRPLPINEAPAATVVSKAYLWKEGPKALLLTLNWGKDWRHRDPGRRGLKEKEKALNFGQGKRRGQLVQVLWVWRRECVGKQRGRGCHWAPPKETRQARLPPWQRGAWKLPGFLGNVTAKNK